jgi:hypothetical protein
MLFHVTLAIAASALSIESPENQLYGSSSQLVTLHPAAFYLPSHWARSSLTLTDALTLGALQCFNSGLVLSGPLKAKMRFINPEGHVLKVLFHVRNFLGQFRIDGQRVLILLFQLFAFGLEVLGQLFLLSL